MTRWRKDALAKLVVGVLMRWRIGRWRNYLLAKLVVGVLVVGVVGEIIGWRNRGCYWRKYGGYVVGLWFLKECGKK